MPLLSTWFRANSRLQRCLVSDPAHVTQGSEGEHVRLIQSALIALAGTDIELSELASSRYGPSTARAVLDYKTARRIINFAYQTKPDNTVGKMTIAALDTEMAGRERRAFRLTLSFGVATPTPQMVILTEPQAHAQAWAAQIKTAQPDVQVHPA